MTRLATSPSLSLLLLLALLSPVAAAAPGEEGEKPEAPQPKTGVSRILGTLDWGAGHAEVLERVKADLDARYAKELEHVVDTLKIDRILRRKAKEFAQIKNTFVRFTGQRTGYETSLIADDFSTNANEAVLRVDDASAQRYYFFKDDRLWKIVVAYNSSVSRAVPFADFVKQVQEKYGEPQQVDWHTPAGGEKSIRSAVWEDEITHLAVEDRTSFFGTFVMKFVDKAQGLAIEQARLAGSEDEGLAHDPKVDSAIADIMVDEGGGSDDVVDQLTGVEHGVDLESGKPKWAREQAPLQRASELPAQARRGKEKPARKARGKKKKAAPAPQPAADPVIIY